MPRTVFDVPALNARQQDLEQLAAQPDFWDDQQNAQKKMRSLDEVKAQLSQLGGWRSAVDDAQATLELYELEPDDDLLQEAQTGLNQLRQGWTAGNWSACLAANTTRKEPSSASMQEPVERTPKTGPRCCCACTPAGRKTTE